MSETSRYCRELKKRFLHGRETDGGIRSAFLEYVRAEFRSAEYKFKLLEIVDEAAKRAWQAQARRKGPDLFSVADYTVPEFLTRPRKIDWSDSNDDEDDGYEKVDQDFSTINDLHEDTLLKFRKAAQNSAKAERQMEAVDEARRRARGNMAILLKDIAD